MSRDGLTAVAMAYFIAIISAVIVPDYRGGVPAIIIHALLTPLAISLILVLAWANRSNGIKLWVLVLLALGAFSTHFTIALALYAWWVQSTRFDPQTYGLLKSEWVLRLSIFTATLVLTAVYNWAAHRAAPSNHRWRGP
jgi:hypothetical protein